MCFTGIKIGRASPFFHRLKTSYIFKEMLKNRYKVYPQKGFHGKRKKMGGDTS
jgi:hypothetical protein